MRWSYKTVHYDYKKEGILGGAFLDEAEIEQSMNEFGQAGWELVSLFEVQDGLMAIFKQSIDPPLGQRPRESARFSERSTPVEAPVAVVEHEPLERDEPVPEEAPPEVSAAETEPEITVRETPASTRQTFRAAPAKKERKRNADDDDVNGGVGSIRIE